MFANLVDIDDSIKISDVLDKLKLLKNTFVVAQGKPVPGMPQLYQALRARLANPTFFYLSASPWQLYPFLHDFVTTNYPFGQIILRSMSYVELSSFLVTLTIGAQEYKEDRMEKIHRWFPNKQFFCIGDSTQKDPEAYGAMYVFSVEEAD
jgi:phosphatidate phosphatase APP1